MGSRSDLETLQPALDLLAELAVHHESRVVSAHRTPHWMYEYAQAVEGRGVEVVVAAAGGAAHLPGMLASLTLVPVLGVPMASTPLQGVKRIATQLDVVGLLAVEMFWTRNGELLVNELAPRPHNTFHATEQACPTNQFEQLVRSVCGLPLGETALQRPTAIGNLFGDLWLDGKAERLVDLLGTRGLQMRLYGKAPRSKRKLGHLACTAETPDEALAGVRRALRRLEEPRSLSSEA